MERIDKRTKEYKFICLQIKEIENKDNRAVLTRMGYSEFLTGLRFCDIRKFHTFNNN